MKYRIVQRKDGFIIESSHLGLFWKQCSERHYTHSWNGDSWEQSFHYEIYKTVADAKEAIQILRRYPTKYKGHRIDSGIYSYGDEHYPVYVDLNTKYKQNNYRGYQTTTYTKGSRYPKVIKGWIDSVEDGTTRQGKMEVKVIDENVKSKYPW